MANRIIAGGLTQSIVPLQPIKIIPNIATALPLPVQGCGDSIIRATDATPALLQKSLSNRVPGYFAHTPTFLSRGLAVPQVSTSGPTSPPTLPREKLYGDFSYDRQNKTLYFGEENINTACLTLLGMQRICEKLAPGFKGLAILRDFLQGGQTTTRSANIHLTNGISLNIFQSVGSGRDFVSIEFIVAPIKAPEFYRVSLTYFTSGDLRGASTGSSDFLLVPYTHFYPLTFPPRLGQTRIVQQRIGNFTLNTVQHDDTNRVLSRTLEETLGDHRTKGGGLNGIMPEAGSVYREVDESQPSFVFLSSGQTKMEMRKVKTNQIAAEYHTLPDGTRIEVKNDGEFREKRLFLNDPNGQRSSSMDLRDEIQRLNILAKHNENFAYFVESTNSGTIVIPCLFNTTMNEWCSLAYLHFDNLGCPKLLAEEEKNGLDVFRDDKRVLDPAAEDLLKLLREAQLGDSQHSAIRYLAPQTASAKESAVAVSDMDHVMELYWSFFERVMTDDSGFFDGMNGRDLIQNTELNYFAFTYTPEIAELMENFASGTATADERDELRQHFVWASRDMGAQTAMRSLMSVFNPSVRSPGDLSSIYFLADQHQARYGSANGFTVIFDLTVKPAPKSGSGPVGGAKKKQEEKAETQNEPLSLGVR